MKYRLIDKTTGIETLCDKVTIDGIDYYVSDEKLQIGDYLQRNNDLPVLYTENFWFDFGVPYKKVIATNNPNIDILKVVDEVGKLAEKFIGCKYEDIEDSIDQIGCDSFKRGYNKSQETHPFNEEDMIEFAEWRRNFEFTDDFSRYKKKELLQLWKEQKTKTLYYA